ncbi:MAG: cyclic nucleotide-binding domain-containing protein [Cyanobacteria bacterium P01_A01_bin.105]
MEFAALPWTRPAWTRPDRLTQLLLLAATVLVYSVLSMAIGNSLFVSYVGASHLPLAFVLIGLCSIPAYILFSQVVDRYSRPVLFRWVLLASIAIALALRFVLNLGSPVGYYALLIAVFFQWDFHNNVLYPSLLTDYFTTLEYKRYAPYIGMAQAAGTLLGGGLTTVLSQYFRTRDLLMVLPVVFFIAIAQLLYLENSQRRLNKIKAEDVGIVESLRSFPDLVQRYPLALFLAGSSFLLVMIYLSSEFLWFTIYGENFTDQQLTGFLGLMRILISVVQVAVIYGVTRPLLKNVGVARLNAVYPLTTLASFGALLANFGLPSAIALHVNGDALYKAINLPVHQLNYNAIPREFIGRIRTLSDGVIYAVGLTLVGLLLWLGEHTLTLPQITAGVTGLTVLFLLVRIPMGRFYANGLEEMIRSNSLSLDEFDAVSIPVTPQSADAVRELLTDPDRYTQLKGLELAARMGSPEAFLAEVEALLPTADEGLYGAAIALFTQSPQVLEHFQQQLQNPDLPVRQQAFAAEILLINRGLPAPDSLQTWGDRPEPALQLLAAVADSLCSSGDLRASGGLHSPTVPWPAELDSFTARILTRIVAHRGTADLMPLIPQVVLSQENPEVILAGLEALLPLAQQNDQEIAAIAVGQVTHANPLVRMTAYDLLRVTRCRDPLQRVGDGLGDEDPRVRQKAAVALAAYRRAGLAIAKDKLKDPSPEVVNTAITAIGRVRTKYASNLLFDYLGPDYRQLARTRQWQQRLPDDPNWEPLRAAIQDYHDRLIQKVLFILSALGHARTVNSVNRLLATQDQSELENAIEALASLSHRRFVQPLMPLLEARVSPPAPRRPQPTAQPTPQWLRTKGYQLLLEALESKDRWLKTGALIALSVVPSALVNDPDPFVKQVASQIFGTLEPSTLSANTAMNRLLLLKNVALFKNLSLDELLLIDKGLEQTQVLAGETIFAEGDWGAHLFIVADGTVQLVKAIDGDPRELKQVSKEQYFGEIALFDDAPRWDSAIALTDCILLKLEKNRFLSLITQRPHIILEICRFLSQRLRETDKHRFSQAHTETASVDVAVDSRPLPV